MENETKNKNGDEPINVTYFKDGELNSVGLTKREYFAALALQGLISNVDSDKYNVGGGLVTDKASHKAKFCVLLADALLKELETNK